MHEVQPSWVDVDYDIIDIDEAKTTEGASGSDCTVFAIHGRYMMSLMKRFEGDTCEVHMYACTTCETLIVTTETVENMVYLP